MLDYECGIHSAGDIGNIGAVLGHAFLVVQTVIFRVPMTEFVWDLSRKMPGDKWRLGGCGRGCGYRPSSSIYGSPQNTCGQILGFSLVHTVPGNKSLVCHGTLSRWNSRSWSVGWDMDLKWIMLKSILASKWACLDPTEIIMVYGLPNIATHRGKSRRTNVADYSWDF